MTDPVYIYDEALLKYRFNSTHPFNQMRLKMTTDLLMASGHLKQSDIVKPREATDEELELVHKRDYIEAVKLAGKGELPENKLENYGLDTEDTPSFKDMHDKSRMLVGATLTAVEAVMEGRCDKALNLSGGLHHGFSGRAGGFCIYNDTAVAIEYLRTKYNKRVLYIDTDAHHGDGVQWIFYHTNEVMTYSIHETGRYLFPGTGSLTERGTEEGFGYAVNLPIDAFTEDDSFLSIFKETLEAAIIKFKPDVIFSQNGVDAHFRDPMTHLSLTSRTFEEIPRFVNEMADKYTDGKWIAVGGGGYNIWQVVPRMWAQVWLAMNSQKAPRGRLPESYMAQYQKKCPVDFPINWEDALDDYMDIPRRDEINEKNRSMMSRAMLHLEQQ
ncbi:acetoin utilization protein AcuC [Salinicoccus cyprini]|uniref:Acetoin utilization protein AcuC n=1 Tax=Salinicoccus cyprini TaxID=2493691 RepID=A0A558AZS9_9STAP|nr:acetoin utilization protein AcuC [Salinicoccus cyprini]TVT29744.1 acetoin utilization protein AcuC [Salinicoccus cyprini]